MQLFKDSNAGWLPYTAVILLAAVYTQPSSYFIQPDIDGGMVWAVNDFFSFRQTDAFFYPHTNGPLTILKLPTEKGHHILMSVVFNFLLRCTFGFYLLLLGKAFKPNKPWIAIALFIFFLSVLNFDFIFLGVLLAGSYYALLSNKLETYIPIAVLTAIAIYTKGSISLPALCVSGSMFFILIYQKDFKTALRFLITFLTSFIILSVLLYANPFDGIKWFMEAMLGTFAYGNNQAVHFNNFLPFLIPSLLFVLIPIFLRKEKKQHLFYFMTVLLVILFWKYVLGRQDFTHYRAWYFFCFLLFGFSLLLLYGKRAVVISACYFVSFLFFISNAKRADSPKTLLFNTPNISSFARSILKPNKDKKFFAVKSNQWSQDKILSDSSIRLIENETVDAFPWEHSIIRKYKLNYLARPNFYSTLLGEQADLSDAEHYASQEAPTFIVWHDSETDDYMLNGHNKHYLPNLCPLAIESIKNNYQFISYQNGYALWKKDAATTNKTSKIKGKMAVKMNSWFEAPSPDSINNFYGKINFQLSLEEKLRSAIYKGRFFNIYYQLANGEIIKHNLSVSSMRNGFLLQPYYINPALDYQTIIKIKITARSEKFSEQQLSIQYKK